MTTRDEGDVEARTTAEPTGAEREQLASVMRAWRACFGGSGWTIVEVMMQLSRLGRSKLAWEERERLEPLQRALEGLGPAGRAIHVRRVERFLARMAGRAEAGLQLEKTSETRAEHPVWRVVMKVAEGGDE